MKKISKNRASKELDKILESVAKPKVEKAQEISKFKKRLSEQAKKGAKGGMSVGYNNTPGINITNKVLKDGGKQNQDAIKAVADKLKNYLDFKNNSHPEFPHQNNSKTDYKSPMYRNNSDQEDYIDDWRGGGLSDLEYGTEPSDDFKDNFKKYLDGSSDKGNAQTDGDGVDLGNVVSNKVGERIQKTLKRKHKKLQGSDGMAIPNDWTQHPNPGYIPESKTMEEQLPKLAGLYEDRDKEGTYMGAPSQVEKRDVYDGRAGEVVGVYSNIKDQRDMDEDSEGEETYNYGEDEGHDKKEEMSMEDHIDAIEDHLKHLKDDMGYDEDHEDRDEEDTDFSEGELKEDSEGEETYNYGEDEGHDKKEEMSMEDHIDAIKDHLDHLKDDMGYDEDREDRDEKDTDFREEAKPDFLDLDKDGNTEEPMKKAAKDAKKEKKESLNEGVKTDMSYMKHLISYNKNTQ